MEKIMPLKAGTKIDLPPKEKYELDRDDKVRVKKASFEKKKDISKSKKTKPVKAKAGKTKSVKTASLKQKKDKA